MLPHEMLLVLFFEMFGVSFNEGSLSLGEILVALGIY